LTVTGKARATLLIPDTTTIREKIIFFITGSVDYDVFVRCFPTLRHYSTEEAMMMMGADWIACFPPVAPQARKDRDLRWPEHCLTGLRL
jgi:hypothetical protein